MMIGLLFLGLAISVAVNVIVIWYVVRLLKKYIPISQDLEDLFDRLDEYHGHIKLVSEMESFYGDDILMNLLRHSRAITHEVDEFREVYSLIEEEDPEELLELEEGEELDDNQEEDTSNRESEVLGVVQNRRQG